MARRKGNSTNRSQKRRERADRKRIAKHSKRFPELSVESTPEDYEEAVLKRKHEPPKPVQAKTQAQGQLISQIVSKDITIVSGPAGTGKTYVTASMAAEMLAAGEIERIVITRPMVACGEDMGFLPGEMEEKYAPWVAPIMDVLEEKLGKGKVKYLLKAGQIVLSPMQFMRGASMKNSFVICDEAQNITPSQMKMFLTRLGEGSKMVIDGDLRQSDLKDSRGVEQISGLADAAKRLRSIPEVGFVEFERSDIVRHGLTRKILEVYEN